MAIGSYRGLCIEKKRKRKKYWDFDNFTCGKKRLFSRLTILHVVKRDYFLD